MNIQTQVDLSTVYGCRSGLALSKKVFFVVQKFVDFHSIPHTSPCIMEDGPAIDYAADVSTPPRYRVERRVVQACVDVLSHYADRVGTELVVYDTDEAVVVEMYNHAFPGSTSNFVIDFLTSCAEDIDPLILRCIFIGVDGGRNGDDDMVVSSRADLLSIALGVPGATEDMFVDFYHRGPRDELDYHAFLRTTVAEGSLFNDVIFNSITNEPLTIGDQNEET